MCFIILHNTKQGGSVLMFVKPLGQAWANFVSLRPRWVLKFDMGAGSGTDGWSVHVNRDKLHVKVIHKIAFSAPFNGEIDR